MLQQIAMVGVISVLIGAMLAAPVQAQSGGQFCARAFEDRNGNGTRDAGEPWITRGIGATLQDASGVIVATAVIDNSPTAGQGVICFQGLAFAQYTMTITSAEFTATTGDSLVATVVQGEVPPRLEYGGERIAAQTVAPVTGDDDATRDELIERAVVSGLGALGAMLVTAIIGLFLYAIAFRGRRTQPAYYDPRATDEHSVYRRPPTATDTGSMRAVPPPTDTGEYPREES